MQTPNLDYVDQLAEGDITFKTQIIAILKKEFPVELEIFIKNYHQKNYTETANNIHKIKYKLSLLGLTEDFKLATQFENEIKNGNTNLFDIFISQLNKISDYLKTIQ